MQEGQSLHACPRGTPRHIELGDWYVVDAADGSVIARHCDLDRLEHEVEEWSE